jgi:hypothetical protein
MLALANRLILPGLVCLVLLAALLYQKEQLLLGLDDPKVLSGWSLIGVIVFLALINTRKKLIAFNLGSVRGWLAFHIAGGFLAVAIFLLHSGTFMPMGLYEQVIAILFWSVSATGLLGVAITVLYPSRLTEDNGAEVTYERVPSEIFEIRKLAESEIISCTEESGQSTLSKHYEETIGWYFRRPRFYLNHVMGGGKAADWIQSQGNAVRRYLDEKEMVYLDRLLLLASRKTLTDKHFVSQDIMRKWLVVHIPLSVALLGMSVWHIILIHVYAL